MHCCEEIILLIISSLMVTVGFELVIEVFNDNVTDDEDGPILIARQDAFNRRHIIFSVQNGEWRLL